MNLAVAPAPQSGAVGAAPTGSGIRSSTRRGRRLDGAQLQERSRHCFLLLVGTLAIAVGGGVVAVGLQIVRGFLGYVDAIDAITR